MNNNRNSNSNRRRGRNPNRPQGGGGGGGGGGNQLNRIDSRARGNAPQLLDKYKKLAQDAQHNGDRVQAEYYLQFADHYFRVLNDNKARQDEARAPRGDKGGRDDQNDGSGDSQNDGDNEGRNEGRNKPRAGNPRSNEFQDPRGDDDDRRPRRSRYRQDEDDSRDEESDDDRDRSGNERSEIDGGYSDRGGDRANGARPPANGRSRSGSSYRDQNDDPSDDFEDAPAPQVRPKPERAPRKPAAKPVASNPGEFDIAVLPPAIGKVSDETPSRKASLRPRRKRADDSETLV
ncbi:DUF4167 domain-containing protein [Allopontixanthobacter sp.]|uniref:DUF4167 domain-containing protein n=1 Tax=Allopontixanthobacter sp. TaxID=2906452 RepID=UPI002ABAC1DF|nr:DUF4167 domain-containing protein [Allopontixanthobacter sp.]MDZ4307138.1 DUF4167 domain-containing protein [Allopontixanthobacter sp.]